MCHLQKETVTKIEKLEQKTCDKHNLVIRSGIVLSVLKQYTDSCLNQNGKLESANKATTMVTRLERVHNTISRLLSPDDIEHFWKRYREIFSNDKEKLWNSLEHGLKVYLKILQKRDSLDTECEFLRKQNSELKHMLEPYRMMTQMAQTRN